MKKRLKQIASLAIMLILSSFAHAQWTQIGQDIDGEAAGDYSGHSVSLSANGLVVAIGAFSNHDNGLYAGHVRIYRDSSGTWTQVGSDINGEASQDFSGSSVSLSADGTIVAIGAYNNEGNGIRAGHVRVYKDSSGIWTQIGNDIDSEAADNNSGYSVSINANGLIVAIGAPMNSGNGRYAGHVRIYQNNAGSWTQIGNDIDGEAEYDQSGRSVSISADGNTVAIGSPFNCDNGFEAGHVRVYRNLAGTWTQIGNDIDGEAAGDQSGSSVSISADGTVVAIGAPFNDGNGIEAGHVRVYENIAGTWTQIGNDIDGEAGNDYSGLSVSLCADGSVVAIGAPENNGNGTRPGQVRIYQNIFGTWTQIGSDIDGEAILDNAGRSVSISADASVVAIGAPYNDGNGTNSGHVRIYTNPNVGVDELNNTVEVSVYPNPTTGKISIQCENMEKIELLDITGRIVYKQAVSNNMFDVDISTFNKGVYFIKVTADDAIGVEQIVLE